MTNGTTRPSPAAPLVPGRQVDSPTQSGRPLRIAWSLVSACNADMSIADVVWLSRKASEGVLPDVLDAEGVRWRVHDIDNASGADDLG
jgi:hypothetical protein